MHVISLLHDSYAIHVDFNEVQIKFNFTAAFDCVQMHGSVAH